MKLNELIEEERRKVGRAPISSEDQDDNQDSSHGIGDSKSWGPYPSGGIGLVLLIVIILLLMGRI